MYVPAVVGAPVSWRVAASKLNPGTDDVRPYISVPSPPLAVGNVNASMAVPTV